MGYKLYRERYGVVANKYVESLRQSEELDGQALLNLQSERFVHFARHAIAQVPYYRNWAKKNGFGSEDIRSLESLNLFPIIDKTVVKTSPERFIADNYKGQYGLIKLATSGTTGTPLLITCDKNSRTHHYAFLSRLRRQYGLDSTSKRATLFGRIIMLPEQNVPPFWRYDIAQRNLLMSSYHLSKANIPHYYRKLLSYKPEEIFSYPSSIMPIANYILENGLRKIPLKLLITTAEPLPDYQREILRSAFDAPIVNQYGCTEMAFFADETENGEMRLHPEHGIAEVEVTSGEVVSEGVGEFIATGLINYTMPLIRYRIGDTISIRSIDVNKSGRNAYPRIMDMVGRTDDLIYRKDGTPVGRLDPVFKQNFSIKNAQIIQHENFALEILVETGNGFDSRQKLQLISAMKQRVGEELEVKITTTHVIEKSLNGKFRAVKSYVKFR